MEEAGFIRDCLGYARARLSVFIPVWTWSSCQTTNPMTPSGMGLLVCGAGSRPLWCDKKDVPTGVNLNQYAGPGSLIRWHSENEPLFGPQNSPKLIASLSLWNSVEFKVRRRAPRGVTSLRFRLDHGDILVMGGLAQSEYEHCTASGLQGPRVNLTFRCGCAAHCVLSTRRRGGLCPPFMCARFSRAGSPRGLGLGEINGPLLGV